MAFVIISIAKFPYGYLALARSIQNLDEFRLGGLLRGYYQIRRSIGIYPCQEHAGEFHSSLLSLRGVIACYVKTRSDNIAFGIIRKECIFSVKAKSRRFYVSGYIGRWIVVRTAVLAHPIYQTGSFRKPHSIFGGVII